MQLDPFLITILALAVTAFLSSLFVYFYRVVGGKMSKRRRPETEARVKSAVHTFDAGLSLHSMDLEISNTTETDMRIDNIMMFDELGREMRYVTRGHTSAVTEFDIGGNETQSWSCFCHRQSSEKTDRVRLKLAIERKGRGTVWKSFESRSVPHGKFPTGEWLRLL